MAHPKGGDPKKLKKSWEVPEKVNRSHQLSSGMT
jgi:hypothetical protein